MIEPQPVQIVFFIFLATHTNCWRLYWDSYQASELWGLVSQTENSKFYHNIKFTATCMQFDLPLHRPLISSFLSNTWSCSRQQQDNLHHKREVVYDSGPKPTRPPYESVGRPHWTKASYDPTYMHNYFCALLLHWISLISSLLVSLLARNVVVKPRH